tara:strand:+ start:438 stop:1121 length:684 start_codon:yes stop_codon:yes gene_type:complete
MIRNNLNQLLLNLELSQNFQEDNFYVSKSNFFVFEYLKSWPNWEKKCLNIVGEKNSGKSHLTKIFLKKNKGIKINASDINGDKLKTFKLYENVILDNFDVNIDEKLIYSLFNIIDQENKFLIINSLTPINEMKFKLNDLKSRATNCLVAKIEIPDDDLIFALVLKNFSDRQIQIDKKLIDFIVKRIDRSYDKIFDFIYKIDEVSLKKKKKIDFKIINEVLNKKDQIE